MMARLKPPQGFLLEPNYFRLAYQLTAQRANSATRSSKETSRRRELAALPRPGYEEARDEALRLSRHVAVALRYLDALSQRSSVMFHRRPTLKELRLQRFLLSTVRPSVELIVAGLLLPGDTHDPDERVSALMRHRGGTIVNWTGLFRFSRVEVVPWSYRAYYNLACFEAARHPRHGREASRDALLDQTGRSPGPAPDIKVHVALWALQQAFRLAHDRGRSEVVRWAKDDPSLSALRDGKRTHVEFAMLVERYGRPAPSQPAPTYHVERRPVNGEPGDAPPAVHREVLRELLAERTGYELHLDALVTAQHPPQRVTADVLLQARDPAKRDVLVNVRVPVRAETSTAGLTSDRAIGATARYEAMTARKALAWVVVVLPDGSDTLPLEERLTTLLAGHGTDTVLERSQLPALRRIPTPGATG